MVRRKSHEGDYCPSARSLDVIGDWWSLLIVRDAFDGMTRFSEFQKSLGISKNILTRRLRSLVEKGILVLVSPEHGGAHMEYRLTEMGRDLFPMMVALRQCKQIVLNLRTEDGRPVRAEDAVILKVEEG
jgi:DNA-binding HxlR family transcriptional regulator